jgi:signal peptidase I
MDVAHKYQKGNIGTIILDFIQSIVLALSVFVLIYMFVAQPNEVKGSSMVPSFEDKDYLLTDKLTYKFANPQRGDVVVFKAPATELCAETECEYIKRVIGIPGDRIKVAGGKVYLNGELLKEVYLPKGISTSAGTFSVEGVEKMVPPNQYLCFGDNRSHSRDGREFGPVGKDRIVGRAFFRYWPTKSFGLVPRIRF